MIRIRPARVLVSFFVITVSVRHALTVCASLCMVRLAIVEDHDFVHAEHCSSAGNSACKSGLQIV